MDLTQHQDAIRTSVAQALAEDIGSGDITAQLIPETEQSHARVIQVHSVCPVILGGYSESGDSTRMEG